MRSLTASLNLSGSELISLSASEAPEASSGLCDLCSAKEKRMARSMSIPPAEASTRQLIFRSISERTPASEAIKVVDSEDLLLEV